jgi:hypothetical protein
MDPKSTTCLLCENAFDPDELQTFQPGFVLNWKKPEDEPQQHNVATSLKPAAPIQHPAVNHPAILGEEPLIRAPQQRRKKKVR